jgi:nucleotide-binding universal stress UspA family protein
MFQRTDAHAEAFRSAVLHARQITAIEKQRRAAQGWRYGSASPAAGAAAGHGGGVDTTPAEGILDAARGHDLIVMGTHGRGGPARWWAGSVAERVVREADVPVLVVRGGDGANTAAVFERIWVIAGTATFAGGARRYATGLAEAFGER